MEAIPEELALELKDAEKAIGDAQDRFNGAQLAIALWHCAQGRHNYSDAQYAIVPKCINCFTPFTIKAMP